MIGLQADSYHYEICQDRRVFFDILPAELSELVFVFKCALPVTFIINVFLSWSKIRVTTLDWISNFIIYTYCKYRKDDVFFEVVYQTIKNGV